jgi:hypothetical protein
MTAAVSGHEEVKLERHRTSEESNATSMIAAVSHHEEVEFQEHQTFKEHNVATYVAVPLGILTVLSVLMAVITYNVRTRMRKRGRYFACSRTWRGDYSVIKYTLVA